MIGRARRSDLDRGDRTSWKHGSRRIRRMVVNITSHMGPSGSLSPRVTLPAPADYGGEDLDGVESVHQLFESDRRVCMTGTDT